MCTTLVFFSVDANISNVPGYSKDNSKIQIRNTESINKYTGHPPSPSSNYQAMRVNDSVTSFNTLSVNSFRKSPLFHTTEV